MKDSLATEALSLTMTERKNHQSLNVQIVFCTDTPLKRKASHWSVQIAGVQRTEETQTKGTWGCEWVCGQHQWAGNSLLKKKLQFHLQIYLHNDLMIQSLKFIQCPSLKAC